MDENKVLELYAKYDSCKKVADELSTNSEAIRRVLIKHGVKRTGNRPSSHPKTDKRLPSNCKSMYCGALVCMLRSVSKLRHKDICVITGYSSSAVGNIIRRNGLTDKRHRLDIDIDAVESEYLAGASTYKLAEKYGVDHTVIGKWMKKRGHVRGKGWSCEGGYELAKRGAQKGRAIQRARAIDKYAAQLKEQTGGNISLVSYSSRENTTLRCNVCGCVFKRGNWSKRTPQCPRCYEDNLRRIAEGKEQLKREKEAEREAEYAKEKRCASCGAVFHSEHETQLYCSKTCRRRRRDTTHRRRARKYGVPYDSSITVESVIERDGITCRICGKPCDPEDKSWGTSGPMYPSVDCIVPMKKGGGYVQDNVWLTHCICNSIKRDLDLSEVRI